MLEHRSSKSCDAKLVVSGLLQTIQLDQASLQQPDSDTKKLIRFLCREVIRCNRSDVFKYLREITPAGTTGECLLVHLGRVVLSLWPLSNIVQILLENLVMSNGVHAYPFQVGQITLTSLI